MNTTNKDLLLLWKSKQLNPHLEKAYEIANGRDPVRAVFRYLAITATPSWKSFKGKRWVVILNLILWIGFAIMVSLKDQPPIWVIGAEAVIAIGMSIVIIGVFYSDIESWRLVSCFLGDENGFMEHLSDCADLMDLDGIPALASSP
ncbi:hypothetical protein KW799_00770, partial [Candidatus Parcubacteria bacterium]|nr:hypothetical protein [Candidatus Parcubacteria bacterium]